MSIDIHKLENGRAGKHLFSIDDAGYIALKPAIDLYKSKTGLYIDQYGDLKLSSGVRPLIESIEAASTGDKIYSSVLAVLKQSEVSGYGIMFVGD